MHKAYAIRKGQYQDQTHQRQVSTTAEQSRGVIDIQFCTLEEMTADILAKALLKEHHNYFYNKLNEQAVI